jgi:arsenate reductase
MLTVYAYDACSTCRKALAWLDARNIPHRTVPIRERPPVLPELERMLAAQPGGVKALCNRSGKDYRELGLAARLPTMSDGEALRLLAGNGNLIKRPFALGPGVALVGFDPAAWESAFA